MRILPGLALTLAACGETPPATVIRNDDVVVTVAATPVDPVASPVPANAVAADEVAPDSGEAAAAVVRRYYALIGRKRYGDAYDLWEPAAVGMSRAAFVASFAKFADYRAEVGAPGRVDAGAGQRYVTVPARAYGTLTAGGPFKLVGTLTLHRTADIDGATAAQRSWRIRSSDMKPRP